MPALGPGLKIRCLAVSPGWAGAPYRAGALWDGPTAAAQRPDDRQRQWQRHDQGQCAASEFLDGSRAGPAWALPDGAAGPSSRSAEANQVKARTGAPPPSGPPASAGEAVSPAADHQGPRPHPPLAPVHGAQKQAARNPDPYT